MQRQSVSLLAMLGRAATNDARPWVIINELQRFLPKGLRARMALVALGVLIDAIALPTIDAERRSCLRCTTQAGTTSLASQRQKLQEQLELQRLHNARSCRSSWGCNWLLALFALLALLGIRFQALLALLGLRFQCK